MGKLPRRSCGSVPLPFDRSPTSRLAQEWDLLQRLGRSSLTMRLNWASVDSTASCSREARLLLLHCRQLQRSSPVVIVPQRSKNRATLVRTPTTPGALLAVSRFAGHHGPSSLTECITLSWWRAHQTRFAAKVSQLECVAASSVQQPSSLVSSPSGVSCSKSLTHPSLGHYLGVCPIPPHTWHLRSCPLPLPFLHFCLCLCLCPWAF